MFASGIHDGDFGLFGSLAKIVSPPAHLSIAIR
jgi:hypothetical protein